MNGIQHNHLKEVNLVHSWKGNSGLNFIRAILKIGGSLILCLSLPQCDCVDVNDE